MHFDVLPRRWQEAPHFGNGLIGSMLYVPGERLHLQVFRADVQDHRDDTQGWVAYSRPRLQIGHFELHTAGRLTGGAWCKDIWNAELTGTLQTTEGSLALRHLVHDRDMVIWTELVASAGEAGCHWTWHPVAACTTRGGYPEDAEGMAAFAGQYGAHYRETLEPYAPNPAGALETAGDISVWRQDLLAGGQYATAWSERGGAEGKILRVSIANGYPERTAAGEAVACLWAAAAEGQEHWIAQHRESWHAYYAQGGVTLPDKGLEALYWQNLYRLGCCSRPGRAFVDCPGLWFQGGNWPYTTTDWNLQAAHWPVYAANRLAQGQELLDRLRERQEELIRAVHPPEWQDDCAYLPIEVAGDLRGNRRQDMRYYQFVGALPWILHNLWLHYRYSMDADILANPLFPLLRRAVNLYLRLIEEGADGRLHLPATYSPETGVFADCNFDLALLKWGCLMLPRIAGLLGIDDPLIPRWQDVARRLVSFAEDEYGFCLGRDATAPDDHRHLSHLLMIYPLRLVTAGTGREVIMRSWRRANAVEGLPAMVQTHAGPIAALLGMGDTAREGLQRLQGDLHPNGLFYTPPCMECTLGLVNIVQEMLLQSWSNPAEDAPGPIRIFPAVPAAWPDVVFENLRAEGAFLVSGQWRAGRTQWVRITSLAGEPCRIALAHPATLRAAPASVRVEPLAHDCYALHLAKGETGLFTCGDAEG